MYPYFAIISPVRGLPSTDPRDVFVTVWAKHYEEALDKIYIARERNFPGYFLETLPVKKRVEG